MPGKKTTLKNKPVPAGAQVESEDSFRSMFANHHAIMLIIEPDTGEILDANLSAEKFYGYPVEKLRTMKITEINVLLPDKVAAERQDAIHEKRNYFVFPHKLASGEERIVEVHSSPIIFRKKQALFSIIHDITERKLAEDSIRYQAHLLENVNDAITSSDEHAVLVSWNHAAETIFGWKADEVIGKRGQDVFRTEFIGKSREEVFRSVNETGQFRGELIQYRKDGTRIFVEAHTITMRDEKGDISGYVTTSRDITERRRAEDALRVSEEKYRTVVNQAAEGIAIAQDQKIKFSNSSLAAMLGYEMDEMEGHEFIKLIPPENLEHILERFKKRLAGEHVPTSYESVLLHKNGTRIPVDINAALIQYEGKPADLVIIRDITERKQAEDALLKSEESLRLAVSAGRMGTWDRNFLSGQLYWSAECKEMFGLTPEIEANDERFINALYPEDRVPTDLAIREALEKQTDFNMEYRVIWPNGTIHWIASQGHGYYDEAGQAIRMTGVTLDITERKRAEETLRQSRENFARVFISSPTALAITRRSDGKFLGMNEAYTKVMGYEPAEILGRTPAEMNIYANPHERDSLIQQIRDQGNVREYELLVNTKSGEVRNLLVSTEPILYDQEESIISTFTDITKRKQAEQKLEEYSTSLAEMVDERTRELRETQEQLVRQERLATLGQVAGSIGHELRNPLGVISNAIYFLKIAQPNATDKVKEYLDIIEKEARTSDKIVTDLLDFARINSVDREAVSVSDLIRQTLNRFPAPSSIEVALNIPTDLPLIFADPHHVVQILGNLTVNAYQAMGTNGGSVEISAASQDDMVSIAVRDYGVGISPDNMSKLFEPLFTTKAKGIGLGLAVSRKLAEANGGRIEVKSEAGAGSTFTVWLPIQRPEGLVGN